jgi:hypothetical protein
MAASVMGLLGSLARQGKTVICTIHQPSSQLFSAFDRLLLIAEGRTAYLGRAHLARDFFLRSALPFNPTLCTGGYRRFIITYCACSGVGTLVLTTIIQRITSYSPSPSNQV